MFKFMRTIKSIINSNKFIKTAIKTTYTYNEHIYTMAILLQLAVVVSGISPRKKQTEIISKAKYEMLMESKANNYLNELKLRWMELHDIPGLFAYNLNDNRSGRTLPGKYGFYVELNQDRSLKRRAPQTIESLKPKFKPKLFNFNKVNIEEVILSINEVDNTETQMIINRSPLTKFHTLVCPDIKSNLVQRITSSALTFCIHFMRNISDADMRMGYNSPGALASVNHLHFHLLHLPIDLYIDNVELQELAGDYAYRLKNNSPTEAICFVFRIDDSQELVDEKINNVYQFTEWLCDKKLPHNVFITHNRARSDLRLFVFVRSKYCVNKDITAFNIGFCEMVGYLPIGDAERFENITEQMVIDRIKGLTENAYESAYAQVKHIVSEAGELVWRTPSTY